MKFSVIWIDRESALIFHLSDERMERKKITLRHHQHHTHRRDHLDIAREEPELFRDVITELAASDQVLLIGPGVAKHHFQAYLNEQKPALSKKIVGIQTVDHPTDHQIAAIAREFLAKATA